MSDPILFMYKTFNVAAVILLANFGRPIVSNVMYVGCFIDRGGETVEISVCILQS